MNNNKVLILVLMSIAIGWFLCQYSMKINYACASVNRLDERITKLESSEGKRVERWGWLRRIIGCVPVLKSLVQ